MMMSPKEWRKVDRVFGKAKNLNGSKRSSYLDQACVGDAALREQVDALLLQHDRSNMFLGMISTDAGPVISHYRIIERIGEGAMGLVYKAEDTRLNRLVAMKALPPWAATNQSARDRLLEEARYASALNHPNIVTIYEIVQDKAGDFIVMEYLSGRTLRDLIAAKGLSSDEVMAYAIAIADALYHAHENEILHRDLKPSNIFVTDGGRIKLLDFGLAIPFEESVKENRAHELRGTSAYMAPERFEGAAALPNTEIFSFGIVLWEMFTGKHPFGSGGAKDSKATNPLGRRLTRRIPIAMEPIVRKCLDLNPAKRFQSMQEVISELRSITGGNYQSNGNMLLHHGPPLRSVEYQKARAAVARMSYESLARSREAATELRTLLKSGDSIGVSLTVLKAMREMILTSTNLIYTPQALREIRALAFELTRLASEDDLRLPFRSGDLACLDLVDVDFSGLDLSGFTFERCFLVKTKFKNCNLRDATFKEAWMRNAAFEGADLTGADFTDADWFNAGGLKEAQLKTIKTGSLMRCPVDDTAMRECVGYRYGIALAAWSTQIREEIFATWNEYLRPGGLRDFVNTIPVG